MPCPLPVRMRFEPAIFAEFRRVEGAAETEPDSLDFASLHGDGELVGLSAYRPSGDATAWNDPAAVWNRGPIRKYTRRVFAGLLEAGAGALASGCPIDGSSTSGARDIYSGVYELGAAGAVSHGLRARWLAAVDGIFVFNFDEPVTAMDFALGYAVDSCPVFGEGPVNPFAQVYTATKRTISGCGCASPDEGATVTKTTGEATETLTTPDTEFAALARAGGAVAGTDRETLPGAYALTEPETSTPLAFADVRAVRVTAAFSRLLVGHAYTLRAWYRLRGLDGRDDTTLSADAAYTPSASSVSIPHDLPVMDGYAVSLVALRLLP